MFTFTVHCTSNVLNIRQKTTDSCRLAEPEAVHLSQRTCETVEDRHGLIHSVTVYMHVSVSVCHWVKM